MYGTELRMERKKRLDAIKFELRINPGWVHYWDEADMIDKMCTLQTYSTYRVDQLIVIGHGLVSLGLDPGRVEDALGWARGSLSQLTLSSFIVNAAQRAEYIAQVEREVPETPEPGRYVEAVHKVGELVADNTAGKPHDPGRYQMG